MTTSLPLEYAARPDAIAWVDVWRADKHLILVAAAADYNPTNTNQPLKLVGYRLTHMVLAFYLPTSPASRSQARILHWPYPLILASYSDG